MVGGGVGWRGVAWGGMEEVGEGGWRRRLNRVIDLQKSCAEVDVKNIGDRIYAHTHTKHTHN